jgi:hypothetical protein
VFRKPLRASFAKSLNLSTGKLALGRSAVEHEVWLKADSLTFVADGAESAVKQTIDFLGAKEKKAA